MADVKIEAAISEYYYRMERRPTMPNRSKILKNANHCPYINHRSAIFSFHCCRCFL